MGAVPGQHQQIAMLAAGMASIIYAVDSYGLLGGVTYVVPEKYPRDSG
jgi:hypothetical protein